jgi:hypothetical protein
MPYIVAYAGSFSASSGWYKTMAAHEFNHATQFYYGYGQEFYYWEATASWLEEYVYPSQNDWASSIYYGYSQQPHISMNASDQNDNDVFWHMYSMAVWNFYLDEHVGGHDLIQEIWENTPRNRQYNYWMPDAIEDAGLDFAEVYTGFLATVAVMDFSEERYFSPPDTADSLPASGAGDRDLPQSLGQSFIRIEDGAAEDGETVKVTFDGEDGVEWFAVIARGSENNLDTYTTIELDEDGAGTGTIEASDGQDLYLIVSPMDDAVGSDYRWSSAPGFDYEWSAEVFEGGDGNGTGNSGGNGNGGGDGKSGLCATSAGAAGLGWMLALGLAGWRRQH